MRLQRFLARSGVASRRGSESLISAGRVRVNGVIITELGAKVSPENDEVCVDDHKVMLSNTPAYLMLNKPAGYLCTMDDPQGRKMVKSLMPLDIYPGLFYVGRLDMDTTGILLLSTDGDFAQHILHPSHEVKKTYIAEVEGEILDADLEPLRKGLLLDGIRLRPAEVAQISPQDAQSIWPDSSTKLSYVKLSIHEGKKHIVKNMLAATGHPVIRLHRESIAGVTLQGLKSGMWRNLTSDEMNRLSYNSARS